MKQPMLTLFFGCLCLATHFVSIHSFQVQPPVSSWQSPTCLQLPRLRPAASSWGTAASTSPTRLQAKLWERLQIEEDPEPMWYLINCVAGLEMDLLRQCREVCKDLPDAVKFVVPTERKTRSHGANRMVTETKVKYQGYVFGKLRLCPEVYEAIQGLDLCRSWMGTVNHRGYKKLPPAPLALNELEVENFGLEDLPDSEPDEQEDRAEDDGVIVDSGDEEEKPDYDEEDLKVYQGLRVEDMVKVTAPGKFFDEDGIVRRLKEGKIFVRFYTYGSMFEEWLEPTDVRKLSNIEVLKGLSGPQQPVTQRDIDGPKEDRYGRSYDDGRPSDLRRDLMGSARGGGAPRGRRQDRMANRYRQDRQSGEERQREERNWNWYKENQKEQQQDRGGVSDKEWEVQAGSGPVRDDDWALGDVDSQWGRGDRRQRPRTRREPRQQRRKPSGDRQDDWSAFVSPATDATPADSSGDGKADDFFESLMSDLSKDLGGRKKPVDSRRSQQPARDRSDEDEFFASLMSELSDESDSAAPTGQSGGGDSSSVAETFDASSDDDFFSSLEAELDSAFQDDAPPPSQQTSRDGDADDFFTRLNEELSSEASDISSTDSGSSIVAEVADESTAAAATVSSPKTSSKAGSRSSQSSAVDPDQLDKCTVPVLKDMLRERGLKVSGKKAELMERLSQAN